MRAGADFGGNIVAVLSDVIRNALGLGFAAPFHPAEAPGQSCAR
jgi:hypothetical protein